MSAAVHITWHGAQINFTSIFNLWKKRYLFVMGTEGEAVHHLWWVLLPGVLLPFVLASAPSLRLPALAFPRFSHSHLLWKTSRTNYNHEYIYIFDTNIFFTIETRQERFNWQKNLSKRIPCRRIDTYQQKRLLRENRNVDTSTRTESWHLSTLKLLRNMLKKIIETHKVRLALINKIVEKFWQKLSEYTKWIDAI